MKMKQKMEQEKSNSKWTMKNIITLAIFTFIIVVIINFDSMLLNVIATPLGALYIAAGVSAVICGPFYMVMMNKIAKRGAFFFTCLLSGLLFLLTGYFFSTVIFIVVGVVGEICMLGKNAYHRFSRNMIGYYIYMLGYISGLLLPMLLFRQQYLDWYSSYSDGGSVDVMLQFFDSPSGPLGAPGIMTVGCVIGALIGRFILTRHIKKARI